MTNDTPTLYRTKTVSNSNMVIIICLAHLADFQLRACIVAIVSPLPFSTVLLYWTLLLIMGFHPRPPSPASSSTCSSWGPGIEALLTVQCCVILFRHFQYVDLRQSNPCFNVLGLQYWD